MRTDGQTDRPTNIATYRAAIAAKKRGIDNIACTLQKGPPSSNFCHHILSFCVLVREGLQQWKLLFSQRITNHEHFLRLVTRCEPFLRLVTRREHEPYLYLVTWRKHEPYLRIVTRPKHRSSDQFNLIKLGG